MEVLINLIDILPELITVFLPGFIFMCVYMKLHNKQFNVSILCLWSLFISYLISSACFVIHRFVFSSYNFNENVKILLYAAIGATLPFIITFLCRSKPFRRLLLKTNYQTIDSTIFDDVIDYKHKTLMTIYLKQSGYYYIGTFCLRDEKDSYIVLINYLMMDVSSNEILFKPKRASSVLISLDNVERIELTYSPGSEVWKSLNKKR